MATSTPDRRCTCAGVSRMPGVSRYSARMRSNACRYSAVSTVHPWALCADLTHRVARARSTRRWSKIAREITERLRAEEEPARLMAPEQAARAQAEEANRAKDEFLTASHEPRTPLNSILGRSGAAGRRPARCGLTTANGICRERRSVPPGPTRASRETRAISSPRAPSRGCRPRSRRAPYAQRC
jgi:signal transduction histidine kinase